MANDQSVLIDRPKHSDFIGGEESPPDLVHYTVVLTQSSFCLTGIILHAPGRTERTLLLEEFIVIVERQLREFCFTRLKRPDEFSGLFGFTETTVLPSPDKLEADARTWVTTTKFANLRSV
jgi:hypothetical protein